MSRSWDYAELSKDAKAAGGPEEYVDSLIETSRSLGKEEGEKEMLPWLYVSAAIGGVFVLSVQWLTKKTKACWEKMKFEKEKSLEITRQEVIDGINEYNKEAEECCDRKPEEGEENE